MIRILFPLALVAAAAGAACLPPTEVLLPGVRWHMDSATCGGPITYRFFVDGAQVKVETLMDGEYSSRFGMKAATYDVSARIYVGTFRHDTTVTLEGDETVTIRLDPYCS